MKVTLSTLLAGAAIALAAQPVPAAQATVTVLHDFGDGNGTQTGNPDTPLTLGSDGNLYGTTPHDSTYPGGQIYRITPGGIFTSLYGFVDASAPGGANPDAALLQDAAGNLWGSTEFGGSNGGSGTLFELAPDGSFGVRYTFSSDPDRQGNADGAQPRGALVPGIDGAYYGVTQAGGPNDTGTVFRFAADGTLTTLHAFGPAAQDLSNADGAYPAAGLLQTSDGSFYGTTYYGGSSGHGTIFRIAADGTLTTLHVFGSAGATTKGCLDGNYCNADGANPAGALIMGPDGAFYGTAFTGGPHGTGTVFRITADGSFAMIHAFPSAPYLFTYANLGGAEPYGALTLGHDGRLYGTTFGGGLHGSGVVYRISARGGLATILHSFSACNAQFENTEGAKPLAGLVQGADGSFYGTTSQCGVEGSGTVFKLTL